MLDKTVKFRENIPDASLVTDLLHGRVAGCRLCVHRRATVAATALTLLILMVACSGGSEGPDSTTITEPTLTPVTIQATASGAGAASIVPIPTAVPLSESLPFPTVSIAHSPDAPDVTQLPAEFILVKSLTGNLPSEQSTGWATLYRFAGEIEDAIIALDGHLQRQGWKIDRVDMDNGEILLILEQPSDQGTGSAILGADASDTLILLTVSEGQ